MFEPPALPEPLMAVLGDVRGWRGPDRPVATSPEERASWLVGLQQLRDAVDAVTLEVLTSFDAAGDGEVLHGAASTQSWLRGALGVAPGEASERVRLARASRTWLGDAVDQLVAGRLTYDHVRSVERAVRHLPHDHRAESAAVLTELATQADVVDLRTAGRHLRFVTDPDGTFREAERQFGRRHLTLSPLLDGMTAVEGLLDAESAALVTAALDPFLVPHGPEDLRSAAQRRADGLVEIVRAACDHRLLPEIASERPHLQVQWSASSASGAVDTGQLSAGAAGAGILPQAPGGGALLHPVGMARIACDAAVTRVLLSPEGVPVELGRTVRLFTSGQRRLLAARDAGCRFPGCHRPPSFTDAHHILSWLEGGTTDVRNGVLLCRYHHRLVHEGGWTIVAGAAGADGPVVFHGPSGQRLESRPRPP